MSRAAKGSKRRPKKSDLDAVITPIVRRCKQTQLEMMEDRGYVVNEEEWDAVESVDKLRTAFLASLPQTKPRGKAATRGAKTRTPQVAPKIVSAYNPFYVEYHGATPGPYKPSIAVVFVRPTAEDSSLKNDIANAIRDVKSEKIDRLIVIYFSSKGGKNRIEARLEAEEFDLSFFEINSYRTNYNDVHTLMTKTERDSFCLEHGMTTGEAPGLSYENSIVRYLGAKPRDFIRVDTESIINNLLIYSTAWFEVRTVPINFVSAQGELEDEGVDEEPEEEEVIQPDAADVFIA